MGALLHQFGVMPAHQVYHAIGGLCQKRLVQAQQLAVPYRPPQHPSKNVAPSGVIRLYAIGSQENQRPPMVGDYPQ